MLDQKGPEAVKRWVLDQKKLLITDTTMRDAHQSLLSTRMRTRDMLKGADGTADILSDCFSLEMWGGATFDVAYRFLHEVPVGASAPAAGEDSQHPVPDAAARRQRRGLFQLPRQPDPRLRQGGRPVAASTCSACSTP